MIITCPACDSRYKADSAQFGPKGRRVRCASCGHAWTHRPETVEFELTQPAPQEGDEPKKPPGSPDKGLSRALVERQRRKALDGLARAASPHLLIRHREKVRRLRTLRLAMAAPWVIAALAWLAMAAAFIARRDVIVDAWPRSASLYRALGHEVHRHGLKLDKLETRRASSSPGAVSVTGEIVNVSRHTRPTMPVWAAARDADGHRLGVWTTEPDMPNIAGGERITFAIEIDSLPGDAEALRAGIGKPGESKTK